MEWFDRFRRFLRATWEELHRVTWPSRQAVMEHTVMVILAIVFFGTFLWLVDIVAGQLLRMLLESLT